MAQSSIIEANEVFGGKVRPRLSVFAEERKKLRVTILLFALVLLGLVVFLLYSVEQGLKSYSIHRERQLAKAVVSLLQQSFKESRANHTPTESWNLEKEFEAVGTRIVSALSGVTLHLISSDKVIASSMQRSDERTEAEETVIDRSSLGPEFYGMEVLYTKREIDWRDSARFVYTLLAVIIAVSVAGLFGIYTLSKHQLQLAEDRSNFASAISHELKTPLTSIRMYLEMLSSGWVKSDDQKETYYKQMLGDTERLSRLVNNALQYTSLEQAILSLELKSIALDDLMQQVVAAIEPQISLQNFNLLVKKDEHLGQSKITLLANPDGFNQIFLNLTSNSLKFAASAEQREIWFGVRVEGTSPNSKLIFYLRDFGPGLEPGREKRVFDLFYRGEEELTRKTSGTGIGLALVAGLAERMGAAVEGVNTEVGAEFRLVFSELR